MKDVMIDLETLSTRPNAAILAIGAVALDRTTGKLGPELGLAVDVVAAQRSGLQVDAATALWWMKQEEAARRKVLEEPRKSLVAALDELSLWLHTNLEPGFQVWGHGSTFDNVILVEAYTALGQRPPFTHRQSKCFRTMKDEFPSVPAPPFEGTQHDALSDARYQARHLCAILQHIRSSPAAP